MSYRVEKIIKLQEGKETLQKAYDIIEGYAFGEYGHNLDTEVDALLDTIDETIQELHFIILRAEDAEYGLSDDDEEDDMYKYKKEVFYS